MIRSKSSLTSYDWRHVKKYILYYVEINARGKGKIWQRVKYMGNR